MDLSVQSDIEILSIQAMEAFARENHISGEEVMGIFQRYQVFEKIPQQKGFWDGILYDCS